MNPASEAILALLHDHLDKTVEHGAQWKRARNLSRMQTLKDEAEQAKKVLGDDKGRISSYLEEICDLKLMANLPSERRHRAEES